MYMYILYVHLHLHVHVQCTMLTKLILYPIQTQWDSCTPLHLAIRGGHTSYVERLLSIPGIDVNIKDMVGCSV